MITFATTIRPLLLTMTAGIIASFGIMASAQTVSQADLNDDGIVNSLDVYLMRLCFNAPASCNPDADFDGDGTISYSDYQTLLSFFGQTVPTAEVSLTGETTINVPVGESVNVVYSVSFVTDEPGFYTIDFNQSPSFTGLPGLNYSNDAFNSVIVGDDETILINETVTGLIPGEYTLTKTVNLLDPFDQAELVTTVNVFDPAADVPSLAAPGAQPSGIPTNEDSVVVFSVRLSGTDRDPDSVQVIKVDDVGNELGVLADLNDAGISPDGAAGDRVYTGANLVTAGSAGVVKFVAIATFPEGDSAESEVRELAVTDLPIGLVPPAGSTDDTTVYLPTNTEVVAGQVNAFLNPETTAEQAEAAITGLGFSVFGYEPALDIMLVGVPQGTDLVTAIDSIEALAEFSGAEPNGVDVIAEWTPNDPSYGTQYGFTQTRADEGWVISRGQGVLVAMLDTGADLDHPDLQANLWRQSISFLGITFNFLGFDMVDGDFVPEDANGHGTHVAGTIAAVTDNATQVAGMAPDATVMVIRTLGPGGGAHSQFADGVRKATDMGAKIINYSGGGSDSTTKQNAVNYAVSRGVLFIAAAGNDSTSSTTSAFPAAYSNVMAIGSTDQNDARSGFSNFGNWVSMAAPGTSILSTWLAGGTNTIGGTSMATPHVAGAAALVWSMYPGLSAADVQDRLEDSAEPLPAALQLGAGRLDVFDALFNGSFEMGLEGYATSGTAASVPALGPLSPQEGSRMGYISSGPAGTNLSTIMSQPFTIQAGITSIPVEITYNFVTEEYPEWVGTQFNDCTEIAINGPLGKQVVAFESVNSSSFTAVGGINLPGGDNTVGMTGWKTVAVDVPVTQGPGTYRIFVTDKGDDIFDSVVLVDDLRFKASSGTVPPLAAGCP